MQRELQRFMNEGKVDFFIDDNNLNKFTTHLSMNGIEYGETNITPNKTHVYDPSKWDSSLRSLTMVRTEKSEIVHKFGMDELDRLIEEKIQEELDCKILDRVCAMLQTDYGKKKIHKAVRSLILNQGMRDIDACLSHIENQLEGVN